MWNALCAEDSRPRDCTGWIFRNFETVSAQQGLRLSETSISSLWVKGFDRAGETLGKDLGFIVFCFEKNNFIYLYFWLFWIFICPMGYYLRAASRVTPVAVRGVLTLVASLVTDPDSGRMGFSSCSAWVSVVGL